MNSSRSWMMAHALAILSVVTSFCIINPLMYRAIDDALISSLIICANSWVSRYPGNTNTIICIIRIMFPNISNLRVSKHQVTHWSIFTGFKIRSYSRHCFNSEIKKCSKEIYIIFIIISWNVLHVIHCKSEKKVAFSQFFINSRITLGSVIKNDMPFCSVVSQPTGCPKKHGNSVTNSISSLWIILWFSIVIPTEKAVICKSFVCYVYILFIYVLTATCCT